MTGHEGGDRRGRRALGDNKTVLSAGAATGPCGCVEPGRSPDFCRQCQGPILSVAVHPGGVQLFMRPRRTSRIRVFDVNNGSVIRTLAGHTGAATRHRALQGWEQSHPGVRMTSLSVSGTRDGDKPLLTIANPSR